MVDVLIFVTLYIASLFKKFIILYYFCALISKQIQENGMLEENSEEMWPCCMLQTLIQDSVDRRVNLSDCRHSTGVFVRFNSRPNILTSRNCCAVKIQ